MSVPDTIEGSRGTGKWPVIAVLLVIAAFNAVNIAWNAADKRVMLWDEVSHYKRSMKCGFLIFESGRVTRSGRSDDGGLGEAAESVPRAIRAPAAGYVGAAACVFGGPKHPPLAYMAAAPASYLGPGKDATVGFSTAVFSAILLLSVFYIGSRLSNGWGGVLSAVVAASMPQIVYLGCRFLLDIPLAAMCALTYAAYVSTGDFQSRRRSVLFGVAFGLGMLVKETFPVFAAPIFAVAACRAASARMRGLGPEKLRNAALAALAAAMTSGFWFAFYLPGLIKVFTKHQFMGGVEMDPAWSEPAGAMYYLVGLVIQCSIVFACAFAPALIVFLKANLRRAELVPILLWMAVPFVFFTLISNKDFRYTTSCLPAVAVVIGSAAASLRPRALAAALSLLLAGFGAAQYACMMTGRPALPHATVSFPEWTGFAKAELSLFPRHFVPEAPAQSQAVRGLVGLLTAERDAAELKGRDRLVVSYTFDLPELSTPVDLRFLRDNLEALYTGKGVEVFARTAVYNPAQTLESDIVVVKLGGATAPPHLEDRAREAVKFVKDNRRSFVPINLFNHSDRSRVVVYRTVRSGETGGGR